MEAPTFGRSPLIPTHFEAPRELEHPLRAITDTTTETLVWIQPGFMRPAYELWGEESVLATLRFRGLSHDRALAASAEGLWTFERAGMDSQEVRAYESGRRYATLTPQDDHTGALTLTDGRTYLWLADTDADGGPRWFFLSLLGKPILEFSPENSPQARLRVRLHADAVRTPRLTFKALLGKYLLLNRRP